MTRILKTEWNCWATCKWKSIIFIVIYFTLVFLLSNNFLWPFYFIFEIMRTQLFFEFNSASLKEWKRVVTCKKGNGLLPQKCHESSSQPNTDNKIRGHSWSPLRILFRPGKRNSHRFPDNIFSIGPSWIQNLFLLPYLRTIIRHLFNWLVFHERSSILI